MIAHYVIILVCVVSHVVSQSEASHTVTACAGTGNEDCDFYKVACEARHRVRLLGQRYGSKGGPCHVNTRHCTQSATSPCCVHAGGDCLMDYTEGDRLPVYRDCSGRARCRYKEAATHALSGCGHYNNSYVQIHYSCVPESSILGFCDNKRLNGNNINIIFDGGATTFTTPTDCLCALSAIVPARVTLHVVDARLLRRPKSHDDQSHVCSSAVLSSSNVNTGDTAIGCTEGGPPERNFIHDMEYRISLGENELVYFNLENLYRSGADDVPTMVWLSLTAQTTEELDVICYRRNGSGATPGQSPTTPTDRQPSTAASTGKTVVYTDPTTRDKTGGDGDDAGVITGVIVGVAGVVLLLLLVVVVLVVWRRKRQKSAGLRPGGGDLDQDKSREYETIERAPRGSVTSGQLYDQIGDIPDVFVREPVYDIPYEHRQGVELAAMDSRGVDADGEVDSNVGHDHGAVSGDSQDTYGAVWDDAVLIQQKSAANRERQSEERPCSNYDHLHKHEKRKVGGTSHLYSQAGEHGESGHQPSSAADQTDNQTSLHMDSLKSDKVQNEYVEFYEEDRLLEEPDSAPGGGRERLQPSPRRLPKAAPRAQQRSAAVDRCPTGAGSHVPGDDICEEVNPDDTGDISLHDGYMEPVTCRKKRETKIR